MRVHPAMCLSSIVRAASAIACASFLAGVAASASAAPREVVLASPSQALAFCQTGAMGTYDIDYISSSDGSVQFGPGYNCVQQLATKNNTKTVSGALLISGQASTGQSQISECVVASAASALQLCNAGGLGFYDIDYILGGRYRTIGGQGYGCGIVTHQGGIGNAICE